MRGVRRRRGARSYGSRGLILRPVLSGTSRSTRRKVGRPTLFGIMILLLSALVHYAAGGCSSLSALGTGSNSTLTAEVSRTGPESGGSTEFTLRGSLASRGQSE